MNDLTNAHPQRIACMVAVLGMLASSAHARPIVLADGTTIMGEYGAGTMTEVQVFYAPNYRHSVGGGRLSLNSHVNQGASTGGHSHGSPSTQNQSSATHDINYLRLNFLPKRWNMESAQANLSAWGSLGTVRLGGSGDNWFAWNVGGQFDYETRRVYAALRTDLYEASVLKHRIDTVQLGIAPYKHDYDTLAVWFVVQARQYAGDSLHQGTEVSALLRLFKRKAWIEAGVTQDGKAQAMLMVNF